MFIHGNMTFAGAEYLSFINTVAHYPITQSQSIMTNVKVPEGGNKNNGMDVFRGAREQYRRCGNGQRPGGRIDDFKT